MAVYNLIYLFWGLKISIMNKLLIFGFLLMSIMARAQYYETGQDHSSIKWLQINTENFQLIYPDYFEIEAQQLSKKLELVYGYGSYSLKHKPKKISIILHTQSTTSNGMVAYAPSRSEFYATPNQDSYPQDWLEQLATHEFRHVVQLDKINSEMPKIIRLILGEQGAALVFGAYLPFWFLEGDAVSTETALSNYGRGRFPSFLMKHRAQLLEKGRYSYDKAYLGSYKDYVPNYYNLGYYLVAGARQRYGSDIWEKTVSRVAQKPLSLNPFSKAIKLQTGFNKVGLYESIFDSLYVEWKNEDEAFTPMRTMALAPKGGRYCNYSYNHWLKNNEIVCYKTSLNAIPAFVRIKNNGQEEKILNPGYIIDGSVSCRGEWLVWVEEKLDLRWEHGGSSLIIAYNLNTRKKYKILPDDKACAPVLSPGLDKVLVVENDSSGNNYLSVYDINGGTLFSRYQTSENNYFLSPVWLNEHEVVCVILTPNGKKLALVDLESKEHKILVDKNLGDIKQLALSGRNIYFIASYSAKNALYSYSLDNGVVNQVYEPRFDAAYPAISEDGSIMLSNYTADGYRPVKLLEKKNIPLSRIKEGRYLLAEAIAAQEKGVIDFGNIDTADYESEAYKKSSHLFNFHSWAPVFIEPYDYEFSPGVSFMSQNKLGTAFTVLGYSWDTSEKTGRFYARYTYKGWYPVFDVEVGSGKRASKYWLVKENHQDGGVVKRDTTLERFKWNETELSVDCRLPLTLSTGAFLSKLQPEIKYELIHYGKSGSAPSNFPFGNYNIFSSRLYYYWLRRQSSQDVYSNFGFIAEANHKFSPWQSGKTGNLTAGELAVYLPGVMPNHGVKIYGGIQQKDRGDVFRLSDVVSWPRGWSSTETKNIASLNVNYALPLANPDFSIWGFAYVKRIKATLFSDFARLKIKGNDDYYSNTNISSYGVELLADINFMRYYSPVKIGIRSSYLKENEEFVFGLLFSVDLSSR